MSTIQHLGESSFDIKSTKKGLGVYKHLNEANVITGYNRPSRRATGAYANRISNNRYVDNNLLFIRGLETDPICNPD